MSDDFRYQPLNSRRVYAFDKCSSTRRIVIFGSFVSILASLGFIVCGVYIWVTSHWNPQHVRDGLPLLYFSGHLRCKIYSIVLNLFVTAFTECAGVMHSTSLRFALFREHRVTYNSNLRLVRGSDERTINSATINAVMAFSLILSYASSSFIFQDISPGTCAILATPTTILGITILLQTCISLFALWDTDILTWSTSPFDTIPAFLSMHDRRSLEYHYPLPDHCACMCAIGTPLRPSVPLDRQPSAWDTRKGVRITIYILWALGLICIAWGGWFYAAVLLEVQGIPQAPAPSWGLIPNVDNYDEDTIDTVAAVDGDSGGTQSGISFPTWLSLYAAMLVTQGGLTLGLHCAEIVAGMIRDEMLWRLASKGGITSSLNSWKYALSPDNWLYIVLLIAKPVLHWIFGLGVEIIFYRQLDNNNELVGYTAGLNFFFAQIFYLGFSIFTIAKIFTVAARYHPKGTQPAAYGNVKTLLRLVDEWEENMYWGHKNNGPPYHAGTSKKKLPAVDRKQEYGGSCQHRNTYL